jgi:hypothetical protein
MLTLTMITIFYKDINNNIIEELFETCDSKFILPEPPDYNSDDENDIKTAKYKAYFEKCFIDYNNNNIITNNEKDDYPKYINLMMYKRILRKYKNIISIKRMIYSII